MIHKGQIQDIKGNVTDIEWEPFTRKLSMAGTHGTDPQQKRKCYVGNHVLVPCPGGPALHVIYNVSTDKLSWKDETGTERHTESILSPGPLPQFF